MSAPVEVTVKGTNYENFRWAHEWEDADTGGVFPFDSYAIEYAIADEFGNRMYVLTEDNGITINVVTGLVTYDIGTALDAGTYTHSARKIAGELSEAVFDGTIVITEGAF